MADDARGMRAWAQPALLPFLLLLIAIVAVPILVMDDRGLPRYRALQSELAGLEDSNARLTEEILRLKAEVEALQTDPATIERIARDELGMLRRGELILQFPR